MFLLYFVFYFIPFNHKFNKLYQHCILQSIFNSLSSSSVRRSNSCCNSFSCISLCATSRKYFAIKFRTFEFVKIPENIVMHLNNTKTSEFNLALFLIHLLHRCPSLQTRHTNQFCEINQCGRLLNKNFSETKLVRNYKN